MKPAWSLLNAQLSQVVFIKPSTEAEALDNVREAIGGLATRAHAMPRTIEVREIEVPA